MARDLDRGKKTRIAGLVDDSPLGVHLAPVLLRVLYSGGWASIVVYTVYPVRCEGVTPVVL